MIDRVSGIKKMSNCRSSSLFSDKYSLTTRINFDLIKTQYLLEAFFKLCNGKKTLIISNFHVSNFVVLVNFNKWYVP